jgi:RNHCP domain
VLVQTPRFSRQTEDFACGHCGEQVRGDGYTNHCPACLWSRHVDESPGDRAAGCRGLMAPVGALYEQGRTVLVQRCVDCGHSWRNRAADGDDTDAVLALFGQVVDGTAAPARDRRRRGRNSVR